jgi:hypothetical protein
MENRDRVWFDIQSNENIHRNIFFTGYEFDDSQFPRKYFTLPMIIHKEQIAMISAD